MDHTLVENVLSINLSQLLQASPFRRGEHLIYGDGSTLLPKNSGVQEQHQKSEPVCGAPADLCEAVEIRHRSSLLAARRAYC